MVASDFDTLAEMLMDAAEIYGKKISGNIVGMYFVALEAFSIDDIRRALNIHVRNPDTGQFMPKPADIVRVISGDTGTQSGLAWTKALDAIRRVGANFSVVFDDQIIHRVITDMGGWPKLCECKEAEIPFVSKEFERRYQGYAFRRAALNNNYPPVMVGVLDSINIGKGYPTANPALIGNPEAAAEVMSSGCGSLLGTQIRLSDHVTPADDGRSLRRLAQEAGERSRERDQAGAGGATFDAQAIEVQE